MKPSDDHPVLGLPEMDSQHEYLYSLFCRIEHSSRVTDKGKTKQLLREIEGYLLFHFDCEEHLMRHYAFPGFDVHQSDHETAGAKLMQFLDDFDADRLNPAALGIFLTGWLMEHSRVSDSEYAEWIKKCRENSR
jgi:hemerythrin